MRPFCMLFLLSTFFLGKSALAQIEPTLFYSDVSIESYNACSLEVKKVFLENSFVFGFMEYPVFDQKMIIAMRNFLEQPADPTCQPIDPKIYVENNFCHDDVVIFDFGEDNIERLEVICIDLVSGDFYQNEDENTNQLEITLPNCASRKLYIVGADCGEGYSTLDVIIIVDKDYTVVGEFLPGDIPPIPIGYQDNSDFSQEVSLHLFSNPLADNNLRLEYKAQDANTTIRLFNAQGALLQTLIPEGQLPENLVTQQWHLPQLQSGLYFVQLESGTARITKRLIKL